MFHLQKYVTLEQCWIHAGYQQVSFILISLLFVFFAAGYVELKDVFRLGAVCALWNISVWAVAGGIWWKVIGLY